MRAILFIFLVAGAITACQPRQPTAPTPSGQLEVTLYNMDSRCVQSVLLNDMVDHGFQVRTATDLQLVFGRETKNAAAALFLGTEMTGPPEERLTFLFLQRPDGGLRIVLSGQYVSNQGTGFEHSNPVTPTANEQAQFVAASSRLTGGPCEIGSGTQAGGAKGAQEPATPRPLQPGTRPF